MMEKHEALYKDVSSLEVISYFRHSSDFDDGVEFILEKLDAIPVADVEPVRYGKWIAWNGMDIPENHGRHKCSICDEFAIKPKYGEEILTKRCPNCGAKMDKGDGE